MRLLETHCPQLGFVSSHLRLRFLHSPHPCRDRFPGMRLNGVSTPDINKMESLRKSGEENRLDDCRGVVEFVALGDKKE